MRIVSFSVRNYPFMLLLFIMIVVVGLTTLMTMPRAEDPEINAPQYPITAIYPGTSPQDMEELVVKPIETRVSELENIKKIETKIYDGVAVIIVHYNYDSDVDDKYQELVREVNALRSELPADIYSLDVKKVLPSDVNVIQAALISENASPELMRTTAEDLKEQLEKIKALKKVEYWGVPDQVVRVDLQLDKIARQHVPLNYVLGAIQSEAVNIPGGSVRAGTRSFNVKTSGKFRSLDEIRNTVVYSANGKVVYLKDVADVSFQQEELKHITRVNGHRAVLVTAAQKPGQNISQTQKQYQATLEAFRTRLPANIDLLLPFDQANNVWKRLSALGVDFLIAIGLVLLTLIPLGSRASLIVMVAIPLSLALGLIAMNLMGFSLNQLSIVGFVVALGLLVDDSIVVVENIERWLREGHSRTYAAVEATKQIGLAVIGCTATLVIAFLPLVFMPEASGDFIRGLPLAVITSVIASMLVSLTIVPFLASKLLKTHANPEGNIFLRALKKGIHGSYSLILDRSLRHPWKTLAVALLLFMGSLQLFKVIGFRIFPTSEKPQLLVNIQMPLQTNLGRTDEMARLVENRILENPDVAFVNTNVGHGNPRIYYNEIPENEKSDFAQLYVQLKDHIGMDRKKELIENWRKEFLAVPGARIEVKDFEQGPPVEAPVAIRVMGDNLDTLRVLSARIEQVLQQIPGAIYVRNEVDLLKSDLKLAINHDKSRSLGIQTADIDRTVRLAISGVQVGQYTDDRGDDFDIVVNTPREKFATLQTFQSLYINNASGTAIPLNQIAGLEFETSPTTIKHLDKKRYNVITAYTEKGVLTQDVLKAFQARVSSMALPAGYEIQYAGEVESEQEAFGGNFMTVVIATIFLFLMVLILEFKTFKSLLIVLSVIPLGVIGGVTMLWLTGYPLSFVAIIGFIGLAGIEVKNSILLVDFTNQLREQGKSVDDAIREAGEVRFLPIVLTSLTAIGGLIPIAMNNNPLISPLALVLIGGLISSTILSRIVTPVIYKLIPPKVTHLEA